MGERYVSKAEFHSDSLMKFMTCVEVSKWRREQGCHICLAGCDILKEGGIQGGW